MVRSRVETITSPAEVGRWFLQGQPLLETLYEASEHTVRSPVENVVLVCRFEFVDAAAAQTGILTTDSPDPKIVIRAEPETQWVRHVPDNKRHGYFMFSAATLKPGQALDIDFRDRDLLINDDLDTVPLTYRPGKPLEGRGGYTTVGCRRPEPAAKARLLSALRGKLDARLKSIERAAFDHEAPGWGLESPLHFRDFSARVAFMTELLGEGGPPADAFVERAEQAIDRWFQSTRRFATAERSFSPDVALDGFPAEALIAKHICSAATYDTNQPVALRDFDFERSHLCTLELIVTNTGAGPLLVTTDHAFNVPSLALGLHAAVFSESGDVLRARDVESFARREQEQSDGPSVFLAPGATRTYRYQYLKPAPSTDAATPAFVTTGVIWFPGYGNEREFTVALRVPGLPN